MNKVINFDNRFHSIWPKPNHRVTNRTVEAWDFEVVPRGAMKPVKMCPTSRETAPDSGGGKKGEGKRDIIDIHRL